MAIGRLVDLVVHTFMHQVMKARAVPREIRMSSAHRRTFRSTFPSTSSPIRGVANWDRFLVCHPHLFLFYLILLTSSVLAVATTDETLDTKHERV